MANQVIDLYILYEFLKRLVTPFEKTDAFKLGVIDKNGKILISRRDMTTSEQKNSLTRFDILVFNMKKLLAKAPGGRSAIASYAAAILLLKEEDNQTFDWDNIDDVQYQINQIIGEEGEGGGAPTNNVGDGSIAGASPGEEPPGPRNRANTANSYTGIMKHMNRRTKVK